MNPMLNSQMMNNLNLISRINQFANQIKQSGKSPEQMFNELVSSGKFTSQQIENAKQFASLMKGKLF